MCKNLKLSLWIVLSLGNFSTFAQTPYNIVMSIHGNPQTQMAFNWFTDVGITGGEVRVMLNGNTITVPATCTSHTNYTENKVVVTGLNDNFS